MPYFVIPTNAASLPLVLSFPEKSANSSLFYQADIRNLVFYGVTINNATVTTSNALTVTNTSTNGTVITTQISGGFAGNSYTLNYSVNLSDGEILAVQIALPVQVWITNAANFVY